MTTSSPTAHVLLRVTEGDGLSFMSKAQLAAAPEVPDSIASWNGPRAMMVFGALVMGSMTGVCPGVSAGLALAVPAKLSTPAAPVATKISAAADAAKEPRSRRRPELKFLSALICFSYLLFTRAPGRRPILGRDARA